MPAGSSGFDFPQLPLALRPRIIRTFESFVPGANREVLSALATAVHRPGPARILLRGAPGTGKTHLLEASCAAAHGRGLRVVYAPLGEFEQLEPSLLAGLDECAVVCVDDVDRVAGRSDWEEALFHLVNCTEASGTVLVVSARTAPAGAGFALPDLVSRLSAAVAYRLRPLEDPDRCAALARRASLLGFVLPEAVAGYVLTRLPRDMHALMRFVDELDRSSLAAHRQVTLPFVRGLLDAATPGRDSTRG